MKKLQLLLLAAAAFLLASCLEIKSTVTVSRDGTATIEESTLVSEQAKALARLGGGKEDQLKTVVMNKEQAEARAKRLGEGVTVKSHEEVTTPDGKSGSRVIFAVADIHKLKYLPFEPGRKDESKNASAKPVTFALDGATLTITSPVRDKEVDAGAAGALKTSPEKLARLKTKLAFMKPLLTGMRATVAIKGAKGIASSSATHVSDDTVTYLDIQFDKLMDNADAMVAVVESVDTGKGVAAAAARFNNVEGIKVESQEVVKVELK